MQDILKITDNALTALSTNQLQRSPSKLLQDVDSGKDRNPANEKPLTDTKTFGMVTTSLDHSGQTQSSGDPDYTCQTGSSYGAHYIGVALPPGQLEYGGQTQSGLEGIPEEMYRAGTHGDDHNLLSLSLTPVSSANTTNSSTDSIRSSTVTPHLSKQSSKDSSLNSNKSATHNLPSNSKTVRIPSRHLREIKSPFDTIYPDANTTTDDGIAPPLVQASWEDLSKQESSNRGDSHRRKKVLTGVIASDKKHSSTGKTEKENYVSVSSKEYATAQRNVTGQVVVAKVEKHERLEGQNDSKLVYKTSPQKRQQASDSDSYGPDIVTVHDRITTVHAQSSIQDSSSNNICDNQDSNSKKSKCMAQGRVERSDDLYSRVSQSDVSVSRFSSSNSNREKAKESLIRRSQSNIPIKRVVKPSFVANDPHLRHNDTSQIEKAESIATAVATSAVVAATHPLMKIQSKLEIQLETILRKVASLETTPSSAIPTTSPQLNSQNDQSAKISELERRLSELTNHRLEHIEKLQQQQWEWQAKMLLTAQTTQQQALTQSKLSAQDKQHNTSLDSHVAVQRNSYHGYNNVHDQPSQRNWNNQGYQARETVWLQGSREDLREEKASPLDTPAPRRVPPLPTSKDNMKKGQSLFEAILSADESPQKTCGSPYSQVSKEAEWRAQQPKVQFETPKTRYLDEKREDKDSSCRRPPLDEYLQVVPKEVSPVNIHPADKDVSETFMNIMEILERTRETRQILDRNIDSVLRNAEPLELEELEYTGSLPSSHVYFKKLVDSYIETVSADIKRDHFIAAEKHVQFMKPERDTNVKPTSKPQGRPHLKEHGKTNPQRRPSMTAPGETNPQRRPRLTEPGKTKPKVNVPEKKTQDRKDEEKETGIDDKSWKPVPSYMDDSYIERVYGKVVRTSPRRSKFVTPAMKSSRKKAIPEPTLLAKAVSVASSATQTAAKRIPTPRDKPMAVSAMQLGHSEQQFPAIWRRAGRAVALGAPRMGGNAFAYVEMTQVEQPSPQSTRSEPQHHGSSSFEEGSYSSLVHSTPKEQENSFGHRPPKSQLRLQSKQLSSKDDETREARDKGGTKSNVRLESVKSTNKVDQLMVQSLPSVSIAGVESRPIREDVEDTKDETLHSIDEESLHGEGIALPGSRGRVTNGHYPGPVFPPQLVSTRCVMPSSSQLAATISRRDLLENRAAEWIEQEVMSRMIMSMHAPTPVGDVECQPRHGKVDEDISINSNQSGLMDALGQDGLQLFVDSGQPVDPSLVCSLVKEVLQEQLADMLGSRSESHTPSLRIVSQTRTIEPFPKMAAPIVKSPVATPQPTPKTSPRSSPLPAQSLQTQTPIYTPEPTIVEPASSESSMISEPVPEPSQSTLEQSPIAPPSIIEPGDRQSTLILHYDVTTPEVTPPPSPDQVVQATPAVSEGSPTPAQSPKPWGDPDSPMSEEGRDTMHGNAPVEIFQPLALAVAIQDEEPEILVMPPPQFNSPKSPLSPPPAPPGDHSTITVSSLSSPESAVSDTVNQSLSQGEWLSQRSEGEMRGGPPSSSMASTLQGTEEITQDGSDFAEDTISEGQVVPSKDHKETNPVVSILAKMYQSQGMPVTYAGEFPPVTPVVISGDKAEETSPGQVVRGDMTKQSPPSEGESRGDHPMSIADLEETVATPAGRLIQIEPVSDTRQPSEETQRGRGDVREDDSTRPTHTHNRYDSFDPRILTPDQMNMDVLLQSGYLSQTFSTEGGATAELIATDKMGPLQHTGMTRTLGSTGGPSGTEYTPSQGGRSQDFLRGSNQRSFANQSFNSTGKSGKTETLQSDQNASFEQSLERDHDGALTLTMDSLDQDDAGLTHIRPDLEKSSQTLGYSGNSPSTQMRGTGPLTVSIKMPSLHGTELTDTESDDISEYSMGD